METPHLGFIVAAYAIAGAVIGGMIAWIVLDYRQLRARLAALEAGRPDRIGGET